MRHNPPPVRGAADAGPWKLTSEARQNGVMSEVATRRLKMHELNEEGGSNRRRLASIGSHPCNRGKTGAMSGAAKVR